MDRDQLENAAAKLDEDVSAPERQQKDLAAQKGRTEAADRHRQEAEKEEALFDNMPV